MVTLNLTLNALLCWCWILTGVERQLTMLEIILKTMSTATTMLLWLHKESGNRLFNAPLVPYRSLGSLPLRKITRSCHIWCATWHNEQKAGPGMGKTQDQVPSLTTDGSAIQISLLTLTAQDSLSKVLVVKAEPICIGQVSFLYQWNPWGS